MSMEYCIQGRHFGIWMNEYDFDDSCLGPSGSENIVKIFLKLLRHNNPRKKYRLACREVGEWCECREEAR